MRCPCWLPLLCTFSLLYFFSLVRFLIRSVSVSSSFLYLFRYVKWNIGRFGKLENTITLGRFAVRYRIRETFHRHHHHPTSWKKWPTKTKHRSETPFYNNIKPVPFVCVCVFERNGYILCWGPCAVNFRYAKEDFFPHRCTISLLLLLLLLSSSSFGAIVITADAIEIAADGCLLCHVQPFAMANISISVWCDG